MLSRGGTKISYRGRPKYEYGLLDVTYIIDEIS
jgi:hypothetical protein